ncbi:MAG TPA: monovalent cation/H(+) antiporter subunit G [Salinivirga sp.]|uniref:monovalent cation/H(+) antiporter subunit G n=1 Tax=Salinivirga sp. TaxID=1970192 RepID=UPI002B49DDB7|nr:monovalent cation/H(+) antiporter subunit G [Salinivirga sp.]HKK60624.1 monovalent cation/H(+) antiporter subunit G [Salinivirga sp.]
MELAGAIIVLLGSVFLFLGALGLLRMPDSFNRIQAGTKASTLGTLLSLAGLIFLMPGWWGKLLVLIIFIILTNPVSSHVLARAAYHIKTPLTSKTVVDKYKDEANPEMDNHKTEAS